jgi:predicted MFS family arabinose efflux permease
MAVAVSVVCDKMTFIMWSVTPVGAVLGGILGGAIGLQPTLLIAAIGVLLAFLFAFFSPLRVLRDQPHLPEEAAGIP